MSARLVRFALGFAILVGSVEAYRYIPWGKYWGIDLQNVWAFHHCAARDQPYNVPGEACGATEKQIMAYPPLLYWSMSWLRLVTMPAAIRIWAAVILLGMLACGWVWARRMGAITWRMALFWALLIAQFPSVLGMERGNNDIFVLGLWTLAAWCHGKDRPALAGGLAGLAAMMKVYPGLAVVAIGPAVVIAYLVERRPWAAVRFVAGGLAAVVVGALVVLPQTIIYIRDVLPIISGYTHHVMYYSHPPPGFTTHPRLVEAALLVTWIAASIRALRRDPLLVWTGTLAISTYFAATSYDYNLITTYPLLLLLFVRAEESWVTFGALVLGLVAVIGNRRPFITHPELHAWLQVAWLAGVAVIALVGRASERAAPAPAPASAPGIPA